MEIKWIKYWFGLASAAAHTDTATTAQIINGFIWKEYWVAALRDAAQYKY